MEKVRIKTHQFLERDIQSKAINNNDWAKKRSLQQFRMSQEEKDKQIKNLQESFNTLSQDLHEIKQCLKVLIKK